MSFRKVAWDPTTIEDFRVLVNATRYIDEDSGQRPCVTVRLEGDYYHLEPDHARAVALMLLSAADDCDNERWS